MSSTKPLLGSRAYVGHETDANQAKCAKPWCNLLVGVVSVLILCVFIGWTIVSSSLHTNHHNKKLISDYSKVELKQILSEDDGYTEAALDDLITDLPNLEGEYDFLQFSGYLEATNSRMIHYWFVEAETDADDAPVFLWTNGGPGCSGLLGFLTEHGPFWVYPDLSLRANEYSWNKLVNMLYVEQPYGVGFSSVADGDSCVVGDSAATMDMDALLRSFVEKFPKYSENDLYISSESFGGHYMPRTALTILQNNNKEDSTLKFKGFVVGNPYTDGYENEIGFMGAIFGHGLIKSDNYELWMDNCWGDTEMMDTLYCDELYIVSYIQAYDLDAYALDYSNCPMDGLSGNNYNGYDKDSYYSKINSYEKSKKNLISNDDWVKTTPQLSQNFLSHHVAKRKISKLLEMDDIESQLQHLSKDDLVRHQAKIEADYQSNDANPWIACADYFVERYLNLDEVKEALNVDTSINWAECAEAVFYGWPEKDWDNGMETVYKTLVDDYDIKILVFSGDDDSVCAIQGTMYWLTRMGWTEDPDASWESWEVSNQLGGFYTRFLKPDGSTAVHFQSVRSAGHMVPQTQPVRALELLRKYLYELD